MSDLKLFLLHDPGDDAYSRELEVALETEIARQIQVPSDRPRIERRPSFKEVPLARDLGPLALVLLVSPGSPFQPDEREAIERHIGSLSADDIRLIPIASEPARNVPPVPLENRVSARLYSVAVAADVRRLVVHVLNLVCLRLPGRERRVFISYRTADGNAIAAAVEQGLATRGYQVWRDELVDRDGVPSITPGSTAQTTIERSIVEHGFVLVIDTPTAPASNWVQEEVAVALRHMLPLLPLVVEDVTGPKARIGGRFDALVANQHEVRLQSAALSDANLPTLLNASFFDDLEAAMNTEMLAHLQSRRRLLRESEARFKRLAFKWEPIDPQRLLFRADVDRDGDTTPELVFRLLVQCAPYDILLDESVAELRSLLPKQGDHFQFGVLVHQANAYGPEKRRLLRRRGGHIMLLRYDEIDQLPKLLAL